MLLKTADSDITLAPQDIKTILLNFCNAVLNSKFRKEATYKSENQGKRGYVNKNQAVIR